MSNSENSSLFAKWALALFIVGILGAILIAALAPSKDVGAPAAALFFGVSELLALVFGIAGWRHTAGKVAVIGTAGILLIVFVLLFGRMGGWPAQGNHPELPTATVPEETRQTQQP